MYAWFSFEVDAERHLVVSTLAGFFTPADIDRLAEARAQAHRALRCSAGRHVTLVDLNLMPIQSQEAVAWFGAMLADERFKGRRLACVVERSLTRMQLVRALGDRAVGVFADRAAAERWLLAADGDTESACAPRIDDARDRAGPASHAGAAGAGDAGPASSVTRVQP